MTIETPSSTTYLYHFIWCFICMPHKCNQKVTFEPNSIKCKTKIYLKPIKYILYTRIEPILYSLFQMYSIFTRSLVLTDCLNKYNPVQMANFAKTNSF